MPIVWKKLAFDGDTQPPSAHASEHENTGGDEINVAGLSGELADGQPPKAHAASHENTGGDEISVAGLSGVLADDQHVIDAEVEGIVAMAIAATPLNDLLAADGPVDFGLQQATDLVVMTVANEAALPAAGVAKGQLCFATAEATLHLCISI